jgi:CheY-like chemotaxis protein
LTSNYISGLWSASAARYLNFKGQAAKIMVAAPEASPKRQRILIVEDEPFITLALEGMLPDLGFDVAGSAAKVSAALELIGRERIDCAILDVNLGLQRIDPVADVLAARGCPFIFTTGYSVPGLPARHAGRAVLQKPFGVTQLALLLRAEFGSPASEWFTTDAVHSPVESRPGDRRPAARRGAESSNTNLLTRQALRGGV